MDDHQAVSLVQHPLRWRKLPTAVQMELIDARQRVLVIRNQIGKDAKVRSMPRVVIHDVAWVSPDLTGVTVARTNPIFTGKGIYAYSALLSGPASIYASDKALRGILLHEFSHCFNYLRRIYRHTKSGSTEAFRSPRPPSNATDEILDKIDREMLERPEDWFSPDDCAIFPYHHSSLSRECANAIFENWVIKGYPIDTSNSPYDLGTASIEFEDDVEEHITQLEGDTA